MEPDPMAFHQSEKLDDNKILRIVSILTFWKTVISPEG